MVTELGQKSEQKSARNVGVGRAAGVCAWLFGVVSLAAVAAPPLGEGIGIDFSTHGDANLYGTANLHGDANLYGTANAATEAPIFAARDGREDQSAIKVSDQVAIRASFDAEQKPAPEQIAKGLDASNNLDHLLSSYQAQGLKMNRISVVWRSGVGTFTIGNDWSNFQDFPRAAGHGKSWLLDEPHTAKQITWASGNGFSIALEQPNDDEINGNANANALAPVANDTNPQALQALTAGLPNLVLSWQGELADQAGQYKLSVLGRKMQVDGVHNDVEVTDSELGWGLKLGGGWRFGDLFAALNVTLGNGIDSLILKRFGRDVAVSSSGRAETMESFSILPSLSYSLDQHSDFHVTLGRYQFMGDRATADRIHTLDTINVGYTWQPWPSAQFGVEVVSKDFEGNTGEQDSTEIKIGAQKSF